jgi:hypothetical protein
MVQAYKIDRTASSDTSVTMLRVTHIFIFLRARILIIVARRAFAA